ncbi:peptidase inhibitor family I36 protein [Streptomyces sp. NPDC056411]|uniref:peptidase inhibitor family I36 protein n=1 Tax=Streptomyces sp. NPDC056411 TaxID=3345813 RepID=UPI0035DE29E1
MRKTSTGLAIAISAVTAMTLATPATAAAATSIAAPWSCHQGNLCVYSKPAGEGKKCEWSIDDPDWLKGSVKCSFKLPRSIFNDSISKRFKGVRFYNAANYKQPLYLIKQGEGKSVNSHGGGFTVRSHRWVK